MARNWAITVGVNKYSFLQPLKFAVRDADAMYQLFSQELDFHQVYRFTDKSPPIPQDYGPDLDSKPTRANLRRFLRTRFKDPFLREGDTLWFFFAGHGIRSRNRDYLMPSEGDRSDLGHSAIPLHWVSERLRRSGADNIILVIDACRSSEGRRNGIGIGKEKQQGVITLFACSPEESSYEIEELKQGAFTHVLLESLQVRGEGNCATVERLYQRLRYYVPQLTQEYKHDSQTPYGVIEPPSKNHLILLPKQVTLRDIETLKKDALTSEIKNQLKLAKQLWVRVLEVSAADPEAIEGIERLSQTRGKPQQAKTKDELITQVENKAISTSSVLIEEQSKRLASNQEGLLTESRGALSKDSKKLVSPLLKKSSDESTGEGVPVLSASQDTSKSDKNATEEKSTAEEFETLLNRAVCRGLDLETQDIPKLLSDDISRRNLVRSIFGSVVVFYGLGLLGKSSLSKAHSSFFNQTKVSSLLTSKDFTLFNCDVVKVDENGKITTQATNRIYQFTEAIKDDIVLELVPIPFGAFQMGSSETEGDKDFDQKPQHEVAVSSFLMGKYQVTQAQWSTVASFPRVARRLKQAPSYFKGSTLPVEQVCWDDAVEFCRRLSKSTGHEYRLPTEAEWEYACRARSITPFHFGNRLTPELANYSVRNTYSAVSENAIYRETTTEVGQFFPNAYGLYDMHGNVWEWCLDHWHSSYKGAPDIGEAWTKGGDEYKRVLRGGGWSLGEDYCRSSKRYGYRRGYRSKSFGFRVVCASWAI